jgi:pyruvate dehydrogenase E2 component (dihydrolipoamide acetyltransferase)
MKQIKLPSLGENITSATVLKVLVKPGETIQNGQSLIEVESEKATIEVPSPEAGVVKEVLIGEGKDVSIGEAILTLDTKEGVAPTEAVPAVTKITQEKPKENREPRVTVQQPKADEPRKEEGLQEAESSGVDVAAAPSVRRLARELGVDIAMVKGTGPAGRVEEEDVKSWVKRQLKAPKAPGAEGETLPDFSQWGVIDRQPMSQVRRKTARHLSRSWQAVARVTQVDSADVTELEKLIKRFSNEAHKLTITPFLVKIAAAALKAMPQVNVSVDLQANEIIYKKYYHIGVAVATEAGLLVPVVKDVDKKNIFQLSEEISNLASRARQRKLSLEEMQGGCFTVTNLGRIGGDGFTPVINWPEAAILGASRIDWRQVYAENQFVARRMLPLSLSYDHRLIDGVDGAKFLRWIVDALEQPLLLELEG